MGSLASVFQKSSSLKSFPPSLDHSNIVNAGFFSYRTLWPILTREFGCLPPSRIVEDQKDVYSLAKDIAPRASAVWKEMCGKYRGLDPKAIEWATFDFLDFALWGNQMWVWVK